MSSHSATLSRKGEFIQRGMLFLIGISLLILCTKSTSCPFLFFQYHDYLPLYRKKEMPLIIGTIPKPPEASTNFLQQRFLGYTDSPDRIPLSDTTVC
jgi:hypothetical protein